MKTTIKFALVIALFCSNAFADGEMGNGGRSCQTGQSNCLIENPTTTVNNDDKDSEDSLIVFVKEFLIKIFG